jgi:hypothetical protein
MANFNMKKNEEQEGKTGLVRGVVTVTSSTCMKIEQ